MNVFFLELRNLRKSVITSILSISCVIFFLLAFFPAMQTESMKALAGAKLEGLDPAVLEAFGLTEMMDFTVITNFFGYVLQFITLAIMMVITQRAIGLLAKEESDGTIEYLYARPVSRWNIFTQKYLAHLAALLLMMIVFAAVTAAGYLEFSDYFLGEAVREAAIFFAGIFYVSLVFSAVGLLLSALLRGGRALGGFTTGIVFGTYILGVISLVVKKLEFLKWLSPMDWIKSHKLMTEGILPAEWAVGIVTIVGCFIAAWLIYRKKDLLV